jgi:hypothetical protein
MFGRKFEFAVVALSSAVGLLGQPAESHAFCGLFHRQPVVANYAPVVAAPACSTCAAAPTVVNYAPAPQVCNYVPQTAYRSVYVNVPVTSYRPVVAADPCTGCATTAMQPVTSYMTQARLVPYTTYRPVMASVNYAPVVAAPTCNACSSAAPVTTMMPTTTYSAPAVVSPGCSSCGSGVTTAPISTTTTVTGAPVISGPIGAATTGTSAISSPIVVPGPTVGAPGSTLRSLQSSPGAAVQPNAETPAPAGETPNTFAPNGGDESSSASDSASEDDAKIESRLKAIPDTTTGTKKSGGYSVPRYNFGDRTTSVQVKRAVYQPAVNRAAAIGPAADDEVLDDSGWHAARK